MDITNIAIANMRHHNGLRETSEITTAALIGARLITNDNILLIIDQEG